MKTVKASNYEGAHNFLRLYYDEESAYELVQKFKSIRVTNHRANDILRAAELEPGSIQDPGVRRRLIKCVMGEEISPVLLLSKKRGLIIVDGYHRVSMVYYLDPFMEIPAKLVC